jgi:hypothetical protein
VAAKQPSVPALGLSPRCKTVNPPSGPVAWRVLTPHLGSSKLLMSHGAARAANSRAPAKSLSWVRSSAETNHGGTVWKLPAEY